MDIKKLIENAKNGNMDSFGEIYEYYRAKGINIAKQYVKTEEDAEDMYQDAFMNAMEHIDSFDLSKDFGPWLNVIIANRCKNYLEKKKPVNFSDVSDEETEFVDTLENRDAETVPESAYDRKELMGIMDEIIDSLPQAQTEAVVLYYYKEMSVKQIAEYQEVPEDTIKSRLNYSRKKVSAAVEEFEKKNGIKIHSLIIVPVLLSLFFENTAKAAFAESVLSDAKPGAHPKSSHSPLTPTTSGAAGFTLTKAIAAVIAVIVVGIFAVVFLIKPNIPIPFIPKEQTQESSESQEDSESQDESDNAGDSAADEQDESADSDGAVDNSGPAQASAVENADSSKDSDIPTYNGNMFVGDQVMVDIDGDGSIDTIKIWCDEYESFEDVYQAAYMLQVNDDVYDITVLFADAYMGEMSNGAAIVANMRMSKYDPDYKDIIKTCAEDAHCHVLDYHGREITGIPEITMLIMDIDTTDGHNDILIPVPDVDNYAGDVSEGFDYTAEDCVYALNYSKGQLTLVKRATATGDTYISACTGDGKRLTEIFMRDGDQIAVKENELFGTDGSHDVPCGHFYKSDRPSMWGLDFTYFDGTVKTEITKVK